MREALDKYDIIPSGMREYLSYNGRHFNKKLCEYAVSLMKSSYGGGRVKKEYVDNLLKTNNITLKSNTLYDYVYVANMCSHDFYGSSISDDRHLALYIKDVIEDKDGYDGLVFNRWYADTVRLGIPIDWYEYI